MKDGDTDALFDALPRMATLASMVVTKMEAMIADGGLRDGSRLPPERDLAEQFGVSRTVIREAVAALSARGLLAVQAGSGTLVTRPSTEAIGRLLNLSLTISGAAAASRADLSATLRGLAGEAADLASERRTDADLDFLSRIARPATEPVLEWIMPGTIPLLRQYPSPDGADDHGAGFLRAVAQAAHNPSLSLVLDCALRMADINLESGVSQHGRTIIDAIRKGDGKAARRAMRDVFDEPEPVRTTKKDKREKPSAH
ncbi:MAG: FadR/GntR family transcriptional regulator [Capsulimonadaceae bacterium]